MSSQTERAAVVAAACFVAVLVLLLGYILFPVEMAALSFAIGVVKAAYKLFDVGEWVHGGGRN